MNIRRTDEAYTPSLPPRIVIGPYVYRVLTDVSKLRKTEEVMHDSIRAYCDLDALEIVIDASAAIGLQRTILWHEIKHAIVDLGHGRDDRLRQEDWILKMTALELDVLRRNPDLVSFLTFNDALDAKPSIDSETSPDVR